jgi:hypothetical protein
VCSATQTCFCQFNFFPSLISRFLSLDLSTPRPPPPSPRPWFRRLLQASSLPALPGAAPSVSPTPTRPSDPAAAAAGAITEPSDPMARSFELLTHAGVAPTDVLSALVINITNRLLVRTINSTPPFRSLPTHLLNRSLLERVRHMPFSGDATCAGPGDFRAVERARRHAAPCRPLAE